MHWLWHCLGTKCIFSDPEKGPNYPLPVSWEACLLVGQEYTSCLTPHSGNGFSLGIINTSAPRDARRERENDLQVNEIHWDCISLCLLAGGWLRMGCADVLNNDCAENTWGNIRHTHTERLRTDLIRLEILALNIIFIFPRAFCDYLMSEDGSHST